MVTNDWTDLNGWTADLRSSEVISYFIVILCIDLAF